MARRIRRSLEPRRRHIGLLVQMRKIKNLLNLNLNLNNVQQPNPNSINIKDIVLEISKEEPLDFDIDSLVFPKIFVPKEPEKKKKDQGCNSQNL